MQRTAFLFKRGRKSRLAGDRDHPGEFFYGYVQLAAGGQPVEILDEGDFGLDGQIGVVWRLVSAVTHAAAGVHLWAVWRLARGAGRARLNAFSVLVATTNTFGLSLALLKCLGLLESRVVFIAMGVADLAARPSRRWACRRLLRPVRTVVISKGEAPRLRRLLGPRVTVAYMPFGVDDGFWTPDASAPGEPYVLSIGNDPQRDYATLIASWRPEFPRLRIVTSQSLPASAANVEVIAGDWRRQILSDDEIRTLVRGALFVVLPLRATIQPSGQSACLQAMACGKAVILSDIEGLWDRALMVDGESCVLVPCESQEGLQRAVRDLLASPDRAATIGRNARRVIERHLNLAAMANEMTRLIDNQSADAHP